MEAPSISKFLFELALACCLSATRCHVALCALQVALVCAQLVQGPSNAPSPEAAERLGHMLYPLLSKPPELDPAAGMHFAREIMNQYLQRHGTGALLALLCKASPELNWSGIQAQVRGSITDAVLLLQTCLS